MAKYKVALIEDDIDLAEVYGLKMKMEGVEAIIINQPERAVTILAQEKPDLILLDIMMPIVSGFEVFENIKKDKDCKNIPIYLWSNLAQEKDKEKAKKIKVNGYLIKSDYTPTTLAVKVKELINKK